VTETEPAGGPPPPRYPLVPVPMEFTTSYGHGTRRGPQAILAAQLQMPTWTIWTTLLPSTVPIWNRA
jgi:arginase family enzyme